MDTQKMATEFASRNDETVKAKMPYEPPKSAVVSFNFDDRLNACNRSFKGCHIQSDH